MAITLYDLAPSPNNVKVRLGLGFKSLRYERVAVDPADRTKVIEVSGQPRTPVLVHDDRVMFDSSAILRYLDANFRETPRLFSADYDEMGLIERWELFSKTDLAPAVGAVFGQFFGGQSDALALSSAASALARAAGEIERALEDGEGWLVGGRLTAADLCCAAFAFYGAIPATAAARWAPVGPFFEQHFRLAEGYPRTREWIARTIAFDR